MKKIGKYKKNNPLSDLEMCEDDIEIVFVDENASSFNWSDGTVGAYFTPSESGTYTVSFIQDSTNCVLSQTINISIRDCVEECIVELPQAFSPYLTLSNNDFYKILSTCENFESYEFIIMNRWGEVVFFTNDVSKGWDGTFKNEKQEIGVYIYNLEYIKEGKIKKEYINGNVTLLR